MTAVHRPSFARLGALVALLLAGAVQLAAQPRFPQLDAGASGKGSFVNRASGESRAIERATVRLRPSGEVRIQLEGRQLDLRVEGRIKSWNGREHVDLELTRFDGAASDAFGWVKLDGRGGFERIELSGKTPVRLSVDFFAERSIPVPPEPPAPEPAPVPPPRPEPSARFSEDWGFDRPGNDLRELQVGRVDQCQEACWREARCAAYAYNQSSRNCYLKGAEGRMVSRRDVVSGVRLRSPGYPGLTTEPGYDQPGSDYVDFPARDLRDCQRGCADDPRCRAYTYNTRSSHCYLKSGASALRPRSDTVTGVKTDR